MERKKDQVYGQLKRAIMDETLPPGSRLPTEIRLARSLAVGQVTLRSALARLEAEGLVERIRSRGTFVTERSRRRTFLLIQPDGTETLETPSRYIAAGLEEEAEKRSVTLEVCPESLFVAFTPGERREVVRTRSISGVILETGHRRIPPNVAAAVRELGLPTVIPHGLRGDASAGFFVLRTDEKKAFSNAFLYLKKHGHRRIASLFLQMPEENPGELRGFSRGELDAFLASNGLASARRYIAAVPNVREAIREQIAAWFGSSEPPTAILCHSDRIAMRVYGILREMALRVPDDVSVMGYSNYPGGQLLTPPLTTVDTRLRECARLAIGKLFESGNWFADASAPREAFTPCLLIERGSVAGPGKDNG
ncbi:MAG: substrate-binding domain-containing protein [Lentisphaeria bacterium]|nr:substrate-binding domain-containing protein [Lentisphaeria bacterium]